MSMRTVLLLVFFSIFLPVRSFAQTLSPKEIEQDLSNQYAKLVRYANDNNTDSLTTQSLIFSTRFTSAIRDCPSSLTYPFKTLTDSNACYITTSSDSLFRVYSWDTWMGGSMHFYQSIFQYYARGAVHTQEAVIPEGEPSAFYSDVYSYTSERQTYYLVLKNAIYSNKDMSQTMKGFAIVYDQLDDSVKIFKANNHLINQIVVNYDFFTAGNHPERPIRLFKYDSEKMQIYVPVVLEDGTVTGRHLTYEFKGRYFEREPTNQVYPHEK